MYITVLASQLTEEDLEVLHSKGARHMLDMDPGVQDPVFALYMTPPVPPTPKKRVASPVAQEKGVFFFYFYIRAFR